MDEKKTLLPPKSDSALLGKLLASDICPGYTIALLDCIPPGGMPSDSVKGLCKAVTPVPPCTSVCRAEYAASLVEACQEGKPVVYRCPVGLLGFFVPTGEGSCILGCGYREKSLDLFRIEESVVNGESDPFAFLEKVANLPISTRDEVAAVAERVSEFVASERKPHHDEIKTAPEPPRSIDIATITERLNAIASISSDIDAASSIHHALALYGETLGILFDLSGVAVLLPENGGTYCLHGTWGLTLDRARLSPERLTGYLGIDRGDIFELREEDCRQLLPGQGATSAIAAKLISGGKPIGLVLLIESDLTGADFPFVKMLTGRLANRWVQLRRDEEYRRQSMFSANLIDMVSKLAAIDGGSELYERILAMAAELTNSLRGSLMLVDDTGETMRIESVIGMNSQLARSLSIKIGSGIAGRVVDTGKPLLVHDIESDDRIAMRNRPRFRTRSFVSVPLSIEGSTLGVINLADKATNEQFTNGDLDQLTVFVNHAMLMVQRHTTRERAELLEELCVTDPLTGLYNRRFLDRRIEEELSRSIRHGLSLTIMMVDLDNFKLYNDLCGHLNGDRALRRVARILRSSARDMDVVTRYGGEEFCIILPGTGKNEGMPVAERIRRCIEQERFRGEQELPEAALTASIGLATFAEDGTTAMDLINAADIALYRAKAEGRNRVCSAITLPAFERPPASGDFRRHS